MRFDKWKLWRRRWFKGYESATTILLRLTKHVVEFEYWMNFVPNYIWEGGRVYPPFQYKRS